MPKPLIAIVVGRSSLALVARLAIALGLVAYAAYFMGLLVATTVACITLTIVALQYRAEPRRWYLRCRIENERATWEISDDGHAWHAVTCRLVRLAPQLSAIELDGRRVWLWPDSSDAESLRHLREVLGDQMATPSHAI